MNTTAQNLTPSPANEASYATDPQWYRDAVIYQVHVKSFYDSNGDGIGDFAGLISKLDYIADLGATAIWLLPFYPSPLLDDGYDIADYRGVHPAYGTLAEVKQLIAEAHRRGIRVITELVLNHTSDQHPWFQRARQARPGSLYRDFYVWSDTDKKYTDTRIIFVDSEKSNWTWDEVAQSYYWHRFYSHQPDLNFDNPRVVKEILSILRYWIELGVDGLRLDAVPYLVEREGTNNENLLETHAILKRIRSELDLRYPGRMLLAEANQWPEDTKDYFGDGDECHMAFHFPLMPRMYMAIAQEDRFPITDILRQTPDIPSNCQWATFLRNHDELTLEMVTESERDFLWETYATDKRARINLGIRRRLAPLMQRDRRRIELMNYLLLSVIGTPVIYYGDEIGMGDNIYLGDRNGVRTPMQWSPDRNGGFSRVADPSRLVLPMVVDPLYAYQTVNAESESADQYSLLMWMRQVIATRKLYPVFGRGRLRLLYPENRTILAYLREDDEVTILCLANLSRSPQSCELDLSEFSGALLVELQGGTKFPRITNAPYMLSMAARGFYWFKLDRAQDTVSAAPSAPPPELQTIVLRGSLTEAALQARPFLEQKVLHAWLSRRRWFGQKGMTLGTAEVRPIIEGSGLPDVLWTEIRTSTDGSTEAAQWQVPLGITWDLEQATALQVDAALTRVRRGAKVGILTDACLLPEFVMWVIRNMALETSIRLAHDEVHFSSAATMQELDLESLQSLRWISGEQSNSTIILENKVAIKFFRRIASGVQPEVEMGQFLSECQFRSVPAFLGEVFREDSDGVRQTLAIAQEFVRNQGDAWSWTQNFLSRRLAEMNVGGDSSQQPVDALAEYRQFADLLGQRVAEMHIVLMSRPDLEEFAPVTTSEATADRLVQNVMLQFDRMLEALRANQPAELVAAADHLQSTRPVLENRLQTLSRSLVGTPMTRIHGDLHLGQVLIMSGDISILDFEGEPAAPLDVRRAKYHPAKDVAGMVRSFDYAGAMVMQSGTLNTPHIADADVLALATQFRSVAKDAFLGGYKRAFKDGGSTTVIEPHPHTLDIFVIDKCIYEILYEIRNRPTWVSVPLNAMLAQIDGLLAD